MPTAIAIKKIEGKPGQVYYPLDKITVPSAEPGPAQVKVRVSAAALNHRDYFVRQHLYPGTTFGVPLLADGSGVVVATGADAKQWQGKKVILNPGTGWKDDPDGPEAKTGYSILGGTTASPIGTLTDELVIDASELEEQPAHLDAVEAAALPLTGLTAWRATMVKCGRHAGPGKNVLITGIGGGVALMALSFAVANGAKVYVSSGSEEKIQRAKELGAAGGVNYKDEGWVKNLATMVGGKLDCIIDGAGGDIVNQGAKLLKAGGVITVYGMTVGPKMPYLMSAVLRNIEVKGSTMGSRKEFSDMVDFVNKKQLKPVVSRVVKGMDIEKLDGLFDDMGKGRQFGKLVIDLSSEGASAKL